VNNILNSPAQEELKDLGFKEIPSLRTKYMKNKTV